MGLSKRKKAPAPAAYEPAPPTEPYRAPITEPLGGEAPIEQHGNGGFAIRKKVVIVHTDEQI